MEWIYCLPQTIDGYNFQIQMLSRNNCKTTEPVSHQFEPKIVLNKSLPERGHLFPVELTLELLERVQQFGQVEVLAIGLRETGPERTIEVVSVLLQLFE